jgi:hypothetical protein
MLILPAAHTMRCICKPHLQKQNYCALSRDHGFSSVNKHKRVTGLISRDDRAVKIRIPVVLYWLLQLAT